MATAPAPTTTTSTAPASTAPAPAATASAPTAPAPKGHNSGGKLDQAGIIALGNKVGELLANAVMRGEKQEKERDAAITYREEAAQELYPVLDSMLGLTEDTRDKFDANKAKTITPDYETLRIAVCRAISQRLKDTVVEQKADKDGNPRAPKFSSRVAKVFSRLVSSYRTGGNGGQTEADKAAREAEKERKVAYKDMAGVLADMIRAYEKGDQEGLNVQVKAAVNRWPSKNLDKLFPKG